MSTPADEYAPQHAANPDTPPQDVAADDRPALSGVLPEQTSDTPVTGVDVESMPEFRSLKGQLPAARFHVKAQLADLSKAIPESMKDGGSGDDVLENIADVDIMIQKMQDLVLDRADDRAAMTAWLCEQENAENALMVAFGKLSENLGN